MSSYCKCGALHEEDDGRPCPECAKKHRPKRALNFTIDVHVDDVGKVVGSLRHIANSIEDNPNYQGVMGGPSGSYAVTADHSPGKTKEEYLAELERYLGERSGE